jgi:hypothetical protein
MTSTNNNNNNNNNNVAVKRKSFVYTMLVST